MLKQIPGFPSYTIDECGNVYGPQGPKPLYLGPKGYYYVSMWNKNTNKHCRFNVHKLVALTYIPNPNNYSVINHIDGNKTNNSISNLEWCTQRDNIHHAYKTGLTRNYKPIIRSDGTVYQSAREAERQTGIDSKLISRVLVGKRKTTGGYSWSYYEEVV